MNIKDVTTTTFGLIVAYLLPGVAGLYTISLYARGARHLFAPRNGSVGFVLLILSALLVGVFLNGVRTIIQHQEENGKRTGIWGWKCKWTPINNKDFNKIKDPNKLACFVAVLDEYYRAYQFFGSLTLVLPPLYVGWARCGVLSPAVAVVLGLLTMAATIRASLLTWNSYVGIGHRILEGPP